MATEQDIQEARAAYKSYLAQFNAPKVAQPKAEPSFSDTAFSLEATGKSLGNVASGVWDTVKDAGWAARGFLTDPGTTLHDAATLPFNPGFYAQVVEGVGGAIPGVTPAARYLADKVEGVDRTPAEYGQMVNQDLTNFGASLLGNKAARTLPGMAKGAATGVKDWAVGAPESVRLAERSTMPEAYANTLNFPSRRTAVERQLTDNAGQLADEFTESNPVANIDPSKGREAFSQFQNNLEQTKAKAIESRKSILQDVADRENTVISMGGEVGLSLGDIDVGALPQLAKNVPGGEIGVPSALKYLQEKFGGRKLSATELNDVRQALDNQISVKGGWDPEYLAARGIEPSAVNAEVSAMKYIAGQIDKSLKSYMLSTSGDPALAEQFGKAGRQIGMAKTYGQMAQRFQTETGEAFIPGSAKQVPPGRGPLGTGGVVSQIADFVAPGRQRAVVQSQGLSREAQALSELQKIVDYNTGALQMPAPRSWSQIKTSMQHLTTVGELAMAMGLIGSIEELASVPDEMARKIVTQVAQNAPGAFVRAKGGFSSEMDGRISSPIDQDLQLEASKDLPADQRAKRIAGIYDGGKLVIPIPSKPELLPLKPLGDIGSLLPDVSPPLDLTSDQSSTGIIDQMRKSMGQHDEKRSGL